MSLIEKQGNIFTTTLPAIGHGVNTEGVMGAGIAFSIRKMYPSVYRRYRAECMGPGMSGGDHLPVLAEEYSGKGDRWILNLASQIKKGRHAKYELVEESMQKAFDWAASEGLEGIAFPQIGCGIGGLDWNKVTEIIRKHSERYPDLTVELWTFASSGKK